MSYQRPTNPNPLSKAEKIELLREYSEYYRSLAITDQSALNSKVPRDAFAALLDRIGKLLLDESKQMASSPGTVREFLDANALPPAINSLLPDEFRTFCLALNALKQWVGAEQSATDRYLLGGLARQACREATANCLVTGETLGPDAELHHPLRDGRPPILLSKTEHSSIEGQLSSMSDDPFERAVLSIRRERNGSWAQLRRGCLDLLGTPSTSNTKASNDNARAFARKVFRTTSTSYAEILAWLDQKNL
jgi:hypothetical protein